MSSRRSSACWRGSIPTAPHEVLLVLDGTIGQNAVAQAEQFNKGLGVTGLVVTKLDGTAKGGVVLAIAQRLNIPIRFVGVGEDSRGFRRIQCAANSSRRC